MNALFKKLWKDEKGVSLVLAALLMVVLMGFLALVVDVGLLFKERRQLVNAADAAALAGAQELARAEEGIGNRSAAVNYAVSYAFANIEAAAVSGVNESVNIKINDDKLRAEAARNGVNLEVEVDGKIVTVNIEKKDVKNFFAGIIGHPTSTVNAAAEATYEITAQEEEEENAAAIIKLIK